MFAPIHQCLIILLIGKYTCYAILVGNSDNSNTKAQDRNTTSKHDTSSENNQPAQVSEDKVGNKSDEITLNTNTTFYYDPDEYLISTKRANSSSSNQNEPSTESGKSLPVPASPAMTSARNGRMLDLDALFGDFAASRANKDRSPTGNRQSRYLSSPQSPSLDVGGGKKLHIQGFIPIVGVKDATDDEGGSGGLNDGHESDQKHRPPVTNDLPYAASSIGHASFGVQRYLNSDQQTMMNIQQQQQQQHVDAKFSGASVIDSLKKPLKKISGFSGNNEQHQMESIHKQSQNCLCVPFYMCKNGYLSESSLSKNQIQQMIIQQQQQQQQQQPSKLIDQSQAIDMKSGQLMSSPQLTRQTMDNQAQYADSYVPVDERSLDGGSMSMVNFNSSNENGHQVSNQSDSTLDKNTQEQSLQSHSSPEEPIMSFNNSSLDSNTQQSSDYTQDILGRMLGLKSSSKPTLSTGSGSQSSNGVCGLLRSCCNIPIHMFPSQEDSNNENLMVQYGNGALASQQVSKYQLPTQQLSNRGYQATQIQSQSQQSYQALQKFQPPQSQQFQSFQTKPLPYGFPGNQISTMQPLNAPFNTPMSGNVADITSLAHRSNQFQSQSPRYQQQHLAQYTRAASMNQQLQNFQQSQFNPQHQAKAVQISSQPLNYNQLQTGQLIRQQSQQQSLGTRKILEGRCGQRQSAGITGRVQNLQYHESSADFGEYPAQAAILKRLAGSENLFVCGGTLISQYWVATAAHCIKKHALADLKIRLGEWDVHRDDEFYPFVEKEVKNLVVHPDFVAGNLVNDIALLRLDSPVDPSLSHVNPACLPSIDETFNHQRCWVTGWGKDSFGQKGSFQSVLQEVELPIVGQSECEHALRQTRLGPHYRLHSGFICAGGEGGRDACEGDGGSGLYCIQDGLIKVAGLVSWGIGCGQAGVPGVYVNLAQYRPWIENIISVDEDIYSPYSNLIGNSLISERSNTVANNSSKANK